MLELHKVYFSVFDKLPVETLRDYEQELYAFIEANEAAIFDELRDKQVISPELEEKMKKANRKMAYPERAAKAWEGWFAQP